MAASAAGSVKSNWSPSAMPKRERGLRRFSGADIGKALLLAFVSILLGWQVVRTSAVDGLLKQGPHAAALVSPRDPRPKVAIAMFEFRQRNGTVSRAASDRAIKALARAPLAEEPFVLAGLRARMAGDLAGTQRLLEEARHRNPRSRLARLILLDGYLRQNRIDEAMTEISILAALIPQASTALVPELAKMARHPATRNAIARVLQKDPAMQEAVLRQLAESGSDPALILHIAGPSAGRRATGPGPSWQSLLMENLVKKGDVGRAYRLWQSFAGIKTEGNQKGLYDGRFEGLPGAPPFNWSLKTGNAGVAERTKAPALEVAYYGRLPAELANQLLILGPGRYRLQFRAEGDATGEGSKLVWTIACQPRNASVMELPLTKIGYAARSIAGDFTIPASGCPAQWLRLSGIQGEFANVQNVTISDVQIRKAGMP